MRNIGVVIPCHNEAPVLRETTRRLAVLLQGLTAKGKISSGSKVYFVDDGSRDETWKIICDSAQHHPFVEGIKLSRNRGHQSALLAGLMHAKGDCLISIDADLQDDLSAIEEMVDAYAAGNDIVYGVRKARDSDTLFKRFSAELYYRILAMMGVEIVFNHADFRLMSRRAIDALREFGEVNLFLRGIIPQLGFNSAIVHYDRVERFAGESKYPLSKMLSLAVQGITSFSVFPLEDYYHHWPVDFRPQFRHWAMGIVAASVYAAGNPRLGVYGAAHVSAGRHSVVQPGSHRGVPGEDLSGNQTQTALLHRGIHFARIATSAGAVAAGALAGSAAGPRFQAAAQRLAAAGTHLERGQQAEGGCCVVDAEDNDVLAALEFDVDLVVADLCRAQHYVFMHLPSVQPDGHAVVGAEPQTGSAGGSRIEFGAYVASREIAFSRFAEFKVEDGARRPVGQRCTAGGRPRARRVEIKAAEFGLFGRIGW